ncbi:MAG TPA: carboxypeptidase regulatory-like domain-containing protein [Thermoanaerobaculia bacterium]|nr:carboxypeptidase regulatory-like domain-containing protein [Thermoanaerobaculia bacterium]
MSLRKYLNSLLMLTLVLAVACGGGKEVVDEAELGEDDHAAPTATSEGGATGGGGSAAAAPVAVADAATLGGTVKFEGAAPKMAPMQMGADPFCASQHPTPAPDEEVVVGAAGELANVLVFVKEVQGNFPPPSTPALLDQKGCKYIPHVTAVQVNQPIQIKNSDATLHNVHAMPEVNSQFNEGQPVQNMVSTKKFDKAEIKPFRIKCDVHGWMKSYMAVLPHPYHSVSQTNGTFSIANLPPGNYTLVAWHEKYGQQEQQVTVGPKEQKQVAFTFKG